MANPKGEFYRVQAESIIKKLNLRKMDGFYCENVEEAKKKLLEIVGSEKKNIAYGGSMTLDENGFKEPLKNAGHNLIIRENYKTPEEVKECKALQINSDFFLMSTNAITLDGELVNIDGRGNRISFLIYGPDCVIVIAGMNKVCANVEDAVRRIRTKATPPNCIRLNCDTPCAKTGVCANCLTNSICNSIVVTRKAAAQGRIKVILVGEELGY